MFFLIFQKKTFLAEKKWNWGDNNLRKYRLQFFKTIIFEARLDLQRNIGTNRKKMLKIFIWKLDGENCWKLCESIHWYCRRNLFKKVILEIEFGPYWGLNLDINLRKCPANAWPEKKVETLVWIRFQVALIQDCLHYDPRV